jgi:hypothetical protein
MKPYICKNCNDEWEFVPKDYKYNKNKYPTTCPFCNMSIGQAFADIKEKEGFATAFKFILKNRIWS